MLARQNNTTVALIGTDVNARWGRCHFHQVIKKLARYVRLPVCMLTTETEQGELEAEMHPLQDAWITKPVPPAHVLNIVGELLAA